MIMNYIKFGNGSKTMVILPGLSLKPICKNPEPVIEAYDVFAKDFTVYLFDPREDVEEGYTIKDMAEDTVIKFNELGLKDIYLFGVSLGGTASLYIAKSHPELIKKMILASTTYSDKNFKLNTNGMIKAIKENNIIELIEVFMRDVYTEDFYNTYHDALIDTFKDLTQEELQKLTIYTKALQKYDLSSEIKMIKTPMLVIGSKKDKIDDYKDMIEIANTVNGDIFLYEDYGHAVFDEASDFKNHIMEFFMD